MRSRTRAALVLTVVLAMVAALAPAALAGRDKPKPDKPGSGNVPFTVQVETVGVHDLAAPYTWEADAFGYPFYWVNAVGDEFRFVVTVDGLSGGGEIGWTIGTTTGAGTISSTEPFFVDYTVDEADLVKNALKVRGQVQTVRKVEAVFTVTSSDEATVTVTEYVDVELEPDCADVGLEDRGIVEGLQEYSGVLDETCRWVPAGMGYWKVELVVPEDATRTPPSIGATLRDHVPGNWCTMDSQSHGGVGGDPRQGPVTGWFYLPESGICLSGGAGGYTMAVGTTTDFILVTEAEITLTGPYPTSP